MTMLVTIECVLINNMYLWYLLVMIVMLEDLNEGIDHSVNSGNNM